MTTRTKQMEAFPKTTMEVLESLRAFHIADVEKAGTALDNLSDDEKVARRYEKAEERMAAARDLVRDIDRAIKELRGMEPTVEDAIRDMKRHAEESGTTVTLSTGGESVTFGAKAVDPITGEVATSTVFALYPGDDDLHETPVGDRTRYGELVADYFTAAGLSVEGGLGAADADNWTVVAEDELTTADGGSRELRNVIEAGDYGKRLLVVAADQGSVTGVEEGGGT